MKKILELIENTKYLSIVPSSNCVCFIKNDLSSWRYEFEKKLKPLLLEKGLDLICVTGHGGKDYKIIRNQPRPSQA